MDILFRRWTMNECTGVIYILTNPSFPQYVKIGYASDLERRLRELNRSASIPFAFRVYATYDVVTPFSDLILHSLIDNLNPNLRTVEEFEGKRRVREFYEMTPEYIYSILKSIAKLSGTESRLKKMNPDQQEIEDREKAEEAERAYRRGPFTFSSIDVKPGEIIAFVSDPTITATVVDDKHIKIGDSITSLSRAAQDILGKSALQGPIYWTYNGKILDDIRSEKEIKCNCN